MTDFGRTLRPAKRRRTQRRDILFEDDIEALDTVTVERTTINTPKGPVEKTTYVPIPSANRESDANPMIPLGDEQGSIDFAADAVPFPDLPADDRLPADFNLPADIDTPSLPASKPQASLYLEEFVTRIDGLMAAIMARESLREGNCHQCHGRLARWRCQDCVIPTMVCRQCMRTTHQSNPLHRIECWTGKFFRPAALWEVGVYILVKHNLAEVVDCDILDFHQDVLRRSQIRKDNADQDDCRAIRSGASLGEEANDRPAEEYHPNDVDESADDEAADDTDIFLDMDRLHAARQDRSPGTQNPHEDTDPTFGCDVDRDEDDDKGVSFDYEGKFDHFTEYFSSAGPAAAGDPNTNQSKAPQAQAMPNASNIFTIPAPPPADLLNNPYYRIAHVNGIHHLAVVTCTCRGAQDIPLELMFLGFVPTTFQRIRTVFTTKLLDMFRLSNLELKASAYQYFQLLHRLTVKAGAASPNLYQDLRKVSRAWRWLKKLKWAGFGHKTADAMTPAAGAMTVFCPACPQPDVNLPLDWKDDPNRWVFRRFFVADGNFKADHIRQKNDQGDIWLSEGGGLIPKRYDYETFLQTAVERRTKAPCENQFRAIEAALMYSKACDITGIVAVACARHGCFAPNSIVNLFRGEQQKNVDYSFLQALKTTNVDADQDAMLIYDIACQYFIHFKERVGHLLPDGITIDAAIGLFHVHGHKEECFFRYAPSFIPGTGVVAGEILESLWSTMNTTTPAMRTASLAHRAEMIDDHGNDSNNKKRLAMAASLINRYQQCLEAFDIAEVYYNKFTSTLSTVDISLWTEEITLAENDRLDNPAAMDIMGSRLAQIDQNEEPCNDPNPNSPENDWIMLGLSMKEKQLELRERVRRLEKDPNEDERLDVDRQRTLLSAQFELLDASHRRAVKNAIAVPRLSNDDEDEDDDLQFDNLDDDECQAETLEAETRNVGISRPADSTADTISPENRPIVMPSSCLPTHHGFCYLELRLRQRQLNRYIIALQEVIAEKSFQYTHVVRVAPRKAVITRARNIITKLNHKISNYSKIYNRCRAALVRLGADEQVLQRYRMLSKDDVKASSAILDPNIPGSSSLRLSWIWQMSAGEGNSASHLREFQRVHWLRSRSQRNRWREETILVGYEMQWTVRYFSHLSELWKERSSDVDPGPAAYAARQAATWLGRAIIADTEFGTVNRSYVKMMHR